MSNTASGSTPKGVAGLQDLLTRLDRGLGNAVAKTRADASGAPAVMAGVASSSGPVPDVTGPVTTNGANTLDRAISVSVWAREIANLHKPAMNNQSGSQSVGNVSSEDDDPEADGSEDANAGQNLHSLMQVVRSQVLSAYGAPKANGSRGGGNLPSQPDASAPTSVARYAETAPAAGTEAANDAASGPAGKLDAMLQSLRTMMPQMSNEDQDVMIAEILAALKKKLEDGDTQSIQIQMSLKRAESESREAKIAEAEKKQAAARKHHHHHSIWDVFKKIGEAIACAVMAIVGATLVATGVGAAAGALMIAGAVAMAIMMANDAVTEATGRGILGNALHAMGFSNKVCDIADIAFNAYLAYVGLVTAVASFFVPGAQAGATASLAKSVTAIEELDETISASTTGAKIADEASKSASIASDAAKTVSAIGTDSASAASEAGEATGAAAVRQSSWSDFLTPTLNQRFQTSTEFVNIGANVMTTGASLGTAVETYQAAMDEAQAQKLQAQAKEFQAIGATIDGLVGIMMQHMKQKLQAFDGMLDLLADQVNDKAHTFGHAAMGARG